MLTSDRPSDELLQEMRALLGLKGPQKEKKELHQILGDLTVPDWHCRVEAVRALEQWRGEIPIKALVQALSDPSSTVRDAAAHTLGMFGEVAVVEPLLSALQDEAWNVRASAIRSLGKLGVQAPVQVFFDTLKDSDPSVRSTAISVLAKLGESLPIDVIHQVLSDESAIVRITGIEALGELQQYSSLEYIFHALEDKEEVVCLEASGALEKLRQRDPQRVADALLHYTLRHHDEMIRATAALALGEQGDQESFRLLAPALYDSDEVVRDAVVWALEQIDGHIQTSNRFATDDSYSNQERIGLESATQETTPLRLFLSVLKELLEDKEGSVVSSKGTLKGEEIIFLGCEYRSTNNFFKERLFSQLEQKINIGPVSEALIDEDPIVCAVARKAFKPEQEKEVMLATAKLPGGGGLPVKLVFCGVNRLAADVSSLSTMRHVPRQREQGTIQVWQQLVTSLKSLVSLTVCEQVRQWKDFRLWYGSTKEEIEPWMYTSASLDWCSIWAKSL